MIRHGASAMSALLLVACAGASSPPAPDPGPRRHVEIRFTDMTIDPQTAKPAAGGNVVWINEAMEAQGAVVFPDGFAASLTCSDPSPLFSKTGTGYQSIPITGDSEDVTLPCPLEPGRYDYQLYIFDAMTGMDDPVRTLQGAIVVE